MVRSTSNRRVWGTCGLAALCVGVAGAAAYGQEPGGSGDPYAGLPSQLTLMGSVRDFRGRDQQGGHTDFQWQPSAGFGHYIGQVQDELSEYGKPVFKSTGRKVTAEFRDGQARNIIGPKPYIAARPGDTGGTFSQNLGGSIHTAAAFNQWFNDVPGVNVNSSVGITLRRQPNTKRYVFDDTLDPLYQNRGGFFPIDNALYGNYSSTGKNYHFTYQLDVDFKYERGTGQVFSFIGDDDVWVFIDRKLVIDLGGVHSKIAQTIDLDRLEWLVDGGNYNLAFFFAERHTTQSNFRIETTIRFREIAPPPSAPLAD